MRWDYPTLTVEVEEVAVPELDVSGWKAEQVADQTARLEAAGAHPEVTTVLRWRSAAERRQDAQEAADEAYRRNLRTAALKGGRSPTQPEGSPDAPEGGGAGWKGTTSRPTTARWAPF